MTLKERRVALGLSREEVSRKVGVSVVAVYQWETGGFRPKYEPAKKLAQLYACTVDEIMDGC